MCQYSAMHHRLRDSVAFSEVESLWIIGKDEYVIHKSEGIIRCSSISRVSPAVQSFYLSSKETAYSYVSNVINAHQTKNY